MPLLVAEAAIDWAMGALKAPGVKAIAKCVARELAGPVAPYPRAVVSLVVGGTVQSGCVEGAGGDALVQVAIDAETPGQDMHVRQLQRAIHTAMAGQFTDTQDGLALEITSAPESDIPPITQQRGKCCIRRTGTLYRVNINETGA